MPQEQVLERSISDHGGGAVPAHDRRREIKHPASELRRLIVAAAKALPTGRSLWFRKMANPRWSR
jgi:hypothetical protein